MNTLESILVHLKEFYKNTLIDNVIKCKHCKTEFEIKDQNEWLINYCICPNCKTEFCFVKSDSNELKLRKIQQKMFLYPNQKDKYLYLLYKELQKYSLNIISSFNRNYCLKMDYLQMKDKAYEITYFLIEKYLNENSKFFITKSFGSFLKLKALQVLFKDRNPFIKFDNQSIIFKKLSYIKNHQKEFVLKTNDIVLKNRFYFYLHLMQSYDSILHFFIKFYKYKDQNQKLVLFIIYQLFKKGKFHMNDIEILALYILSLFNENAKDTWKLFYMFKDKDKNYLDLILNLAGQNIYIPSTEEFIDYLLLANMFQFYLTNKFDYTNKKIFSKYFKFVLKNINLNFYKNYKPKIQILFEKFKILLQKENYLIDLLNLYGEKYE